MADVIYKKGQSANLDSVQIKEGQILVTEDTGEMYVDVTNSDRKKINEINLRNGSVEGSLRTTGSSEENPEYTMGECAFTEGHNTKASGDYSHAGGSETKALSTSSLAFGQGTKAGGKGFKITAATKIDDTTGIYTLTSVTGLEVGMEYNVRLSTTRHKCGKILSISGTTITVDGYPNIALSTKQDTAYNKNNYLTIIDRPDLGDIDVGFFTAAFGENCIAQDRSGFVAGRLNTVVGEYGVALGRGNTAGYAGFVAGRENTVLGDMSLTAGQANTATGNVSSALGRQNTVSGTASFVQGFKNTVSGIYSSAFGIQNEVSGNQSIAIGYNNKDLSDSSFVGGASSKVLQGHNVSLVFGTSLLSGAPRQTIFGTFNDSTSSAKFIFGNGTSESNRKNAFEIFEDGTASLQSQGTLDSSIVQKQYVDTQCVKHTDINQSYDPASKNAQSGKAVAEAINGKQNTLVSGTNIKTINGESILGSGNITVGGHITIDNALILADIANGKEYKIYINEGKLQLEEVN